MLNVKLPPVCLSLAVGMTLAVSHRGHAQPANAPGSSIERAAPPERIRGGWVSGAVGFDGGGDRFVGSVGAHLQRDRFVVTARRDTKGPGDADVVDAIGILFGIAQTRGSRSAMLSAGLSTVDARGYFDRQVGAHRHAVGVTLAGDLAFRAGHRAGAGLGLTGFAHVNGTQSFAGIGLGVSAGRWR
jgi:hypothetical protein